MAKTHVTLTDRQTSALRGALVIAAETFDGYVKESRRGVDFYAAMTPDELAEYLRPKETEKGLILNPHPRFYAAMVEEFTQQAKDVRALIDLVDGADDAVEDTRIQIVQEV